MVGHSVVVVGLKAPMISKIRKREADQIRPALYEQSLYRVVQKTDSQFYFWDNFGNSAPILTIFHCYKHKFMPRKREVLPPTAPLLCDHIT